MAEVETWVVEGYYECPVQFTVGIAALEVEYSAVVAGEALTLRLPSADGVNTSRDELSAPPCYYSEREDLLSSRPELAPFWGRIVKWTANFGAPKRLTSAESGSHSLSTEMTTRCAIPPAELPKPCRPGGLR